MKQTGENTCTQFVFRGGALTMMGKQLAIQASLH